jgi:hypothetical protein
VSENRGTDSRQERDPDQDQDQRLYHLVYGLLISLAFVGADFAFLWPENHAFALVFLAATLSALAIYELKVVYRLPQPIIEASILTIVLGSGCIYLAVGPNLPTETPDHGWLEPANESLPSDNACVVGGDVQQQRPDGMLFTMGKAGMWFQKKSGGKRPLLTVGACTLMSAEFESNRLFFNADIYDLNHELVARVEQNEFHLIPGKFAYADRPDRHTLIVHDKGGNVLVSIYFRNPYAIDVRGTFVCPDGAEAKVEASGALTMSNPKATFAWERGCLINTGGFVVNKDGWTIGPTPCWALDPNDNSVPTQYRRNVCHVRGEPTPTASAR